MGEEMKAQYLAHIRSLTSTIHQLKERLAPFRERMMQGQLPSDQGISLLDVKSHTLLSYCMHLVQLMLLKVHGSSIQEEEGAEGEKGTPLSALIEHRIVLERIKPVQLKLKYQIEKLMKAATGKEEGGGGRGLPLACPCGMCVGIWQRRATTSD